MIQPVPNANPNTEGSVHQVPEFVSPSCSVHNFYFGLIYQECEVSKATIVLLAINTTTTAAAS